MGKEGQERGEGVSVAHFPPGQDGSESEVVPWGADPTSRLDMNLAYLVCRSRSNAIAYLPGRYQSTVQEVNHKECLTFFVQAPRVDYHCLLLHGHFVEQGSDLVSREGRRAAVRPFFVALT